ncbi:hypothetical protein CICLE_v10029761mg [Citrus x clementina]|uniref:Uncharacterized protein n=1 Tax=Citrus clementina TaxID=85681 RepID=V4SFE5_CITCL|nr:hypothetical protein CICLE_v10029761mg [Citrus x clementina]
MIYPQSTFNRGKKKLCPSASTNSYYKFTSPLHWWILYVRTLRNYQSLRLKTSNYLCDKFQRTQVEV